LAALSKLNKKNKKKSSVRRKSKNNIKEKIYKKNIIKNI